MRHLQRLTLMGFVAATLIAGGWLQAQPTPPTASLSVGILATDPTALEGTSSGAFTLLRYGASTSDLVVNLTISGTASNGVDYVAITNVITIPAGYRAVDIPVQPLSDAANRGNKTVVLGVVTNAAYQVLPGARSAQVTIIDDIFNIPPPSVALASPTNGSVFWFGTPIAVTADASDAGNSISSVSFFANDLLLGRATASPYSLVWTNAAPGRYTLFARAENGVGESTLSAPVQIAVTNVVPVVTWLSPTNGSNFSAHQNVSLQAGASDAVNPIASVSFYVNGRILGVVTNTPSSYTWTNVPAGFFILQAAATDTAKSKGWSKQVLINVSRN